MEENESLIRHTDHAGALLRGSASGELHRMRDPESSLTLEHAIRILRKHKWVLVAVIGGTTLAAMIAAFLMRDVYRPTARLEIDPVARGIRTLHEIENPATQADPDYLETQVQLLQSDGLAIRVIRGLQLDKNGEFVRGSHKEEAGAGGSQQRQLRSNQPRESNFLQEQVHLAEPSSGESEALKAFRKKLSVNPLRGSRLVEVSFESHDPRLAQSVTNSLVTQYIDQGYRNRYVTTMEASAWLSSQLNELRQKVAESNEAVTDYQKRFGLVESDERDVPLVQLMAETSRQLSEAQADRIQSEAYVRMLELGQADTIPAIRDDVVYQNLLTRYAETRAQLAKAQTVYGDENANVKKLQGEAGELAAQMDAERARLASRVRTAFDASKEREQLMMQSREKLRAQMGDASSHLVEYRMLKNEALANATLYNTLQARLQEAGIYAGLRSGNIRVVDMAAKLHEATGPHRGLIIAVGFVLSTLLAIAMVFVRESFDNTVRIPDDVRNWIRRPSLGVMPRVSTIPVATVTSSTAGQLSGAITSPRAEILWPQTATAEAEAIRSLRTALLISGSKSGPRVILISSATGGEGKTTIAANLAVALAQQRKTCLVEGDLRGPGLAAAFGLRAAAGLGEVLLGHASLSDALSPVERIPGLTLLPALSAPQSPADLLASEQMRRVMGELRNNFEFVLIDSPPVIPFADARLLGMLADDVILVSRYGLTTRTAITRAAELFAEVNAPLLGVVLNDIDLASADYQFFNYGYSWRRNHNRYDYAKRANLPPSGTIPQGQEPPKSRGAHA